MKEYNLPSGLALSFGLVLIQRPHPLAEIKHPGLHLQARWCWATYDWRADGGSDSGPVVRPECPLVPHTVPSAWPDCCGSLSPWNMGPCSIWISQGHLVFDVYFVTITINFLQLPVRWIYHDSQFIDEKTKVQKVENNCLKAQLIKTSISYFVAKPVTFKPFSDASP